MQRFDARAVLLPSLLVAEDMAGRVVVVFDVLRATTTMTSALSAGAREVVLYSSLEEARVGREGDGLLVGERACLKPGDFDFGNSPGQWGSSCAGKVVHMATTNGTKALLSGYGFEGVLPRAVLAGALVNRGAVARACGEILREAGSGGVTLLCAGTEGEVSFEDLLGCGAVLEAMVNLGVLGEVNDGGLMAMGVWSWAVAGIVRAKEGEPAFPMGFRLARGARNVIAAGLAEDVVYAARPDVLEVVGEVHWDGKVGRLRARGGVGVGK